MKTSQRAIAVGFVLTLSLAWGQGGFNGPGTYQVRNLKSGKAMDLDPRDRTTVVQFPPAGTATQRWTITPAGGGYFYIRNAATGCAIEFIDDRNSAPVVCRTNQVTANQAWRIQPGKDGNAMFIARFGKAIDVPDGSRRDGLRWQIYDRNGDSNQRFVLQRAGGITGALPPPYGDRDRDRGFDSRDNDRDRSRPDRNGRYYDQRDRMWKLAGDGVCFYRDRDFRGDALCTRAGDDLPDVVRAGGGSYRSLKFFGRAREVVIYEGPAFRGDARRITNDQSDLRRLRFGGFIGSYRVN
jgi:hypothetical protein